MAESQTPGGERTAAPAGRGRTWVVVALVLGVVTVLALAALTATGSQVDRLLGEVEGSLAPAKNSMPDIGPSEDLMPGAPVPIPHEAGRGAGASAAQGGLERDPQVEPVSGDPRNPEGGAGTAGRETPGLQ